MTINMLEQQLDEALEQFSSEIRSEFPEESNSAATKADIHETSRQVFYALNSFKTSIVQYLKSVQ